MLAFRSLLELEDNLDWIGKWLIYHYVIKALCVIFTILVSFSWASKTKINVVWIFFEWSGSKFRTMLILVFEVIVQPPKAHFLIFSSETKIMKITHSVESKIGKIKHCVDVGMLRDRVLSISHGGLSKSVLCPACWWKYFSKKLCSKNMLASSVKKMGNGGNVVHKREFCKNFSLRYTVTWDWS